MIEVLGGGRAFAHARFDVLHVGSEPVLEVDRHADEAARHRFIGRELRAKFISFELGLSAQDVGHGRKPRDVPVEELEHRLCQDAFAGRQLFVKSDPHGIEAIKPVARLDVALAVVGKFVCKDRRDFVLFLRKQEGKSEHYETAAAEDGELCGRARICVEVLVEENFFDGGGAHSDADAF